MIDAGRYMPENYSRWRQATAVAGSTLAVALSSTACETPPPPKTTASQGPVGLSGEDLYAKVDPSRCKPFSLPSEELKDKRAAECIEDRRDSRIALVNFALPSQDAEAVASAIEASIKETTNGYLHPDVEVVNPSEVAMALVEAKSSTCVSLAEDFTSVAADATMPQLKDYDHVIGLSDRVDCDKNLGAADNTKKRHAEIFSAQRTHKLDAERLGATGAHEYLHLQGLGHAGTLTESDSHGMPHLFFNPAAEEVAPDFDLKQFFAEYTYNEYGVDNVMGVGSEKVLPVQQDALRWPEVELDQTENLLGQQIPQDGLLLNKDDYNQGKFGFINLAESIKLIDQHKVELSFTKLAFIPSTDEDVVSVNLYFVTAPPQSSLTTVVKAGTIFFGGNEKAAFQYGSQKIAIARQGDSVKVGVTNS